MESSISSLSELTLTTTSGRQTAVSGWTYPASEVGDDGPAAPCQPFRFFDLPYDLRRAVLLHVLQADTVIDIGFDAVRRVAIFPVSRQFHDEAAQAFYGGNCFRLLPTHGRATARRAQPLIRRFAPRYRSMLTSMELRLGPHWTQLPRCWKVNSSLGLEDAIALRVLKVFVEIDPSHPVFNGFRGGNGRDYYTEFSGMLLRDLVARLPNLREVQLDWWPSVDLEGPLMRRLTDQAKQTGKKVTWGPGKKEELLKGVTEAALPVTLPLLEINPSEQYI